MTNPQASHAPAKLLSGAKRQPPVACGLIPFSGAEPAVRVHETDPQVAFMLAALALLARRENTHE